MLVSTCYLLSILLTSFIGRESGERHSLAEIQKMVAGDPEMQSLTEEKKQAYLAELANSRYTQQHGVRANNAAAARDVFKTIERVQNEVCSLLIFTNFSLNHLAYFSP